MATTATARGPIRVSRSGIVTIGSTEFGSVSRIRRSWSFASTDGTVTGSAGSQSLAAVALVRSVRSAA